MARERRRRRGGSADESDAQNIPKAPAYIKRKIPHYSILSDDDLSIIETMQRPFWRKLALFFLKIKRHLIFLRKRVQVLTACVLDFQEECVAN